MNWFFWFTPTWAQVSAAFLPTLIGFAGVVVVVAAVAAVVEWTSVKKHTAVKIARTSCLAVFLLLPLFSTVAAIWRGWSWVWAAIVQFGTSTLVSSMIYVAMTAVAQKIWQGHAVPAEEGMQR